MSASVSPVQTSSIQRYLDPVVDEFTTGEYYREVYAAKQEFFEKAGIVYEDDPEYDQRMSIFSSAISQESTSLRLNSSSGRIRKTSVPRSSRFTAISARPFIRSSG